MAVKSKYKHKQYDLTKGQYSPRGPARNQGMLPRALRDLRYEGGSLVSRPAASSYLGVYGASEDISGDTLTDGDYISGAAVTNLCSDGRRVFGQVLLSEGASEADTPGEGQSGYVVELVRKGSDFLWRKTKIPAPMAARPLATFGPFSAASFNSGVGDQLLFTNWGPTGFDDVPQFHTLNGEAAVGDPMVFRKSSLLTRFPNLAVTKAVGSGYAVAADTAASAFCLIYTDGTVVSTWILKNTSEAAETQYNATSWDARIVGGVLYLITSGPVNNVYRYRYVVPSPATGTYGTTSPNLAASHAATSAVTPAPDVIAISSQLSPSQLKYAVWFNSGVISFAIASLADVSSVSSTNLATTRDYIRALTCNGNVVLAESASSASEFSTTTGLYDTPSRATATVTAFVISSGVLVERPLFAATGAKDWGANDPASWTLDTNLNSHISSNGLVCIGNSIYRVLQKQSQSAGVVNVEAQHICKVKDIDTNGSMHGDLSAVIGGRYGNSLSHWVNERYVALAVGGGEVAFPLTDPGTASPAPPDVPQAMTGLTSNERTAIFDVSSIQMTACEVAPGVTSFGHGWSSSTSGDEMVSCATERPIISALAKVSRPEGLHDWQSGDIVTYRAVAVSSVGGFESFVASPPSSVTIAGGDVEKDIHVTVRINAQAAAVSTIRLYRNVAPMPAGDYQLIGETTAPSGSSSDVTIIDNRLDFQSTPQYAAWRPFDPTGGGVPLQGVAVAGMRDIASVAGRVYVATSSTIVPCQEQQGDDRLPTPTADVAVTVPSRLGAIQHVDALGDMVIASTENAIVGILGDPPNALGQGAIQIPVVISEGTGCNGKPVSTPAGLFVPRQRGITLVDRSRNTQEVFGQADGNESGSQRTLTGAAAYSLLADEAYFKLSGENAWMVLSVGGARWTEWAGDVDTQATAATVNRGPYDGLVAFNSKYLPSSPVEYAPPTIVLGWDSFPDRFTESNASRVLVDGYRSSSSDETACTLSASYNLSGAAPLVSEYTIPASTEARDMEGFRAQLGLTRISGSSFRFGIVFVPDASVKLYIETVAVDVLEETKQHTAGTQEGA